MLTSPCIDCPIHHQGIDKSGPTCMACEARLVYVAAVGSGQTNIVIPPPPKGPPPPASTFGRRTTYKIGPYDRRRHPRRFPGRPVVVRTVMGARRIALGISQGTLADESGSTVRTIAAMESGNYDRTPRPSTLNAIASVLEIPADTLMLPVKAAAKATP